MTFNVRINIPSDYHKWNDRKRIISQIISIKKPDLIGLQEPDHRQLEDILNLNPTYKHIGIAREGGTKGEYSAILYNPSRFQIIDSGTFWLSPTPEKISYGWGAKCLRICTWAILLDLQIPNNDPPVQIMMVNTHLDHVSNQARIEGTKLILQKIKQSKLPVIFTGDFNSTPDSEVIKMIQSELSSTSETANNKINECAGTLTNWKPKGDIRTIDYIFVNKHFTTSVYEIVTEFDSESTLASDHRPVCAQICLI